ncbi:alpha/beta hydrolase [Nocardia uniformis]|uniref:Alpha/beta hydrolase n=1 Tax=Nocardia uniformis TaxID=53432 RepID=A0A849C2H1_9NOCA|nr:alpha/beta hydrolase [Nocardia uniformis]
MQQVAEREVAGRAGGRVRRPAGPTEVDIAYIRPAPSGGTPVVVIPGGPGLASAVPYRAFRRRATRLGLDVVMMEHRGIGLSRRDTAGADLPVEEVTVGAVVDDLAAVLDDAGIERAVIYGCSYGTCLAQVFGVRHPRRVAGMVLDSPMLDQAGDLAATREYRRELLWHGPGPVAQAVRALLDAELVPVHELGNVVQIVYEFAGATALERLLRARLAGHGTRVWRRIVGLGADEVAGPGQRYVVEPDLVAGITHGELGGSHAPDGLPLDPQSMFVRDDVPPFRGEPEYLPAALPGFTWPTAVISGDRDLRAPRPVAQRIADLIPDAVQVPLTDTGHSALDTHRLAALAVARLVRDGRHREIPGRAAQIANLPRRGASRLLGTAIRAGITVDFALPRSRGNEFV